MTPPTFEAPLIYEDGSNTYALDHASYDDPWGATSFASPQAIASTAYSGNYVVYKPSFSPDGLHVALCMTPPGGSAEWQILDPRLSAADQVSIPVGGSAGSSGCGALTWINSQTVLYANLNGGVDPEGTLYLYQLGASASTQVMKPTGGGGTYFFGMPSGASLYSNFTCCYPLTYSAALQEAVSAGQVACSGGTTASVLFGFDPLASTPLSTLHVIDGGCSMRGVSFDIPEYQRSWVSGSTGTTLAYAYKSLTTGTWDIYESSDGDSPGTAVTSLGLSSAPSILEWSPDGAHLAYAFPDPSSGYCDLYIDTSALYTGSTNMNSCSFMAWGPDGKAIAYIGTNQHVWLIDTSYPGGHGRTDTGGSINYWWVDGYILWDTWVPKVNAVPDAQTLGPVGGGSALANNPTHGDGEPVNTATGSFFSSAVDLSLPGIGVPFTFTRTYNSADTATGLFGVGWTDNLDWSLSVAGSGDVTVRSGTGQQLHFNYDSATGSLVPDPGGLASLTAVSGGYELVTADQTHYAFNSSGQLTRITDRNGQGVTVNYTSGVLSSVTDSVGRIITITTSGGRITGISLPDGRSVAYGYTSGRLTSFTDLNGKTVSYDYDTSGLLDQITDQNGHTVVANVYDATSGRVTEQTDGRGHHSYFDWDPSTQTSTFTDARGKTWTDVYDGNALVSQTDPLGNTTSYTYDGNLNMIAVTDPRGNTMTYTYDAAGNRLTATAPAPLSYQQSWTYDSRNDVTSYTDGNGNATTYGYNTAGDLTSITGVDPDGSGPEAAPVTGYGRNPTTGQLTSITDPRGKATDFGYDSHGNLTSVTTPEGEETTYGYDSGGRMTSKVEARGNVSGGTPADYTWSYTYDDANRVLSQTDPLGHETDWTYYPGGQLETITDANNHTTTYSYDNDNNLSSVTAPDTTVTSYSYDDNNNELTKTDANTHTTTYTYDDANQLTSKELPGGQTWTYGYDPDGNLHTTVDANGNATMTSGDGTTTYGHDNLDRLTSIDYSDSGTPDVSYSYDGDGNRTQMTDGAGTVSYGYDNLDRLTGVTRGSNSFSYGYDANSNLTSETYPDSTTVSYGYTDDEQLASATSNSQTTGYGYDPAGNLTTTTYPSSNGYTETDSYDKAGRLTEVDNHNGATILSDFTYTLDPVGNPTQIIRSGDISSTTSYGYDTLDRLTSECLQTSCPLSTDPKTSWTYDNVGNRLTQTTTAGTSNYTYNNDDRLTTVDTASYSYDANGNQTAAGTNSYSYDQANRLTSTTVGSTTTSYSYDGDGDRLTSNDGTTTINYWWDPNTTAPQLDTETDGSGATIRDYLYGSQPISMTTGGGSPATYYYHHDALGSTASLTNATGTAQITYTYDAWGNTTATPVSGAPTNPIQYTSGYSDPTNLTHLGAREYDPTNGRFLQPDAAQIAAGSTYAYTDDHPTTATDPTGFCLGQHDPFCDWLWNHRGQIATGGAIGLCVSPVPGVDLAGCAGATATAYGIRAEQRIEDQGFNRSLKQNLLDALLTGLVFQNVSVPGSLGLNSAGSYQWAARAALAGPDIASFGLSALGSADCRH